MGRLFNMLCKLSLRFERNCINNYSKNCGTSLCSTQNSDTIESSLTLLLYYDPISSGCHRNVFILWDGACLIHISFLSNNDECY